MPRPRIHSIWKYITQTVSIFLTIFVVKCDFLDDFQTLSEEVVENMKVWTEVAAQVANYKGGCILSCVSPDDGWCLWCFWACSSETVVLLPLWQAWMVGENGTSLVVEAAEEVSQSINDFFWSCTRSKFPCIAPGWWTNPKLEFPNLAGSGAELGGVAWSCLTTSDRGS